MHGASTAKAARLQKLSRIVAVPPFVVVRRGERHEQLFDAERYMVRASEKGEDGPEYSHAGQSLSIGPIPRHGITRALDAVFRNVAVQDGIIQEFAAEKIYGVAFCFSRENMFVEYSGIFEGVTGGCIAPFVALLPSSLKRYGALQAALEKIYDVFGPCDVEFAGLVQPRFLQVRPITKEFSVSRELESIKMNIQELSETAWIENDICRVIAEHDTQSAAYARQYLASAQRVFKKYFGRTLSVSRRSFLKIGGQYFMARAVHDQLLLRFLERMKFGFFLHGIARAIPKEISLQETAENLFDRSMALSFAHALTAREDVFMLREKYRARIDTLLPHGVFPADFSCTRPLGESIMCDPIKSVWEKIEVRGEEGITVVPGDFTEGPFFVFDEQSHDIPSGTIVLTKHLYPALSARVPFLKGIVCEHGALTSHVAIVAREYGIPLKIQTPLSSYATSQQ